MKKKVSGAKFLPNTRILRSVSLSKQRESSESFSFVLGLIISLKFTFTSIFTSVRPNDYALNFY